MSRFVNNKAVRLAAEGRVRFRGTRISDGVAGFTVAGDTGDWTVERHGDEYVCDCPARRTCSHQIAAGLWWRWHISEPKKGRGAIVVSTPTANEGDSDGSA